MDREYVVLRRPLNLKSNFQEVLERMYGVLLRWRYHTRSVVVIRAHMILVLRLAAILDVAQQVFRLVRALV